MTRNFEPTTSLPMYLLLLLSATVPYLAVAPRDFTNWDDRAYVTTNASIQYLTTENLGYLFQNTFEGNYVPVTMLSFAFDWQLYGDWAWGYGLTNALIYAACCVVLVFCLQAAGISHKVAWLSGMLFAVHPVHAENVAWISGRKDLLCLLWLLCCLLSFIQYRTNLRTRSYVYSLMFLILAGLSKPTAMSAIAVLWLYDVVLLKKQIRVSLKTLFAHLLICLAILGVAVLAQRHDDAIRSTLDPRWGMLDRAACKILIDMLRCWIPIPFSPFYPNELLDVVPRFVQWICLGTIALISTATVWKIRTRWVQIFSFCWFGSLSFLVPVCGIVPLGWTSFADRYLLIPSIAACVVAAWLLSRLSRPAIIAAVMLAIVALGTVTHVRALCWSNSIMLWQSTLSEYPKSSLAWKNLTTAYYLEGNKTDAAETAMSGFRTIPTDLSLAVNAGEVLLELGEYQQVEEILRQAESHHAHSPELMLLRGRLYLRRIQPEAAREEFERAMQLRPDWSKAFEDLSYAFEHLKDLQRATQAAKQAASLMPGDTQLHLRYVELLLRQNRSQDATRELESFTKRNPYATQSWKLQIDLLRRDGKYEKAKQVTHKATRYLPLEKIERPET